MSVEIPDPAPEVPASEPMALDDSENDSKPIVRSKNSSSSSSATPPSEQEDGPSTPSSKKRSPSPAAMPAQTRKPPAGAVQLIGDLPISRKDALATFKEIPCNNYQNKSIGRSKEMFESMTCDCAYEHGTPFSSFKTLYIVCRLAEKHLWGAKTVTAVCRLRRTDRSTSRCR